MWQSPIPLFSQLEQDWRRAKGISDGSSHLIAGRRFTYFRRLQTSRQITMWQSPSYAIVLATGLTTRQGALAMGLRTSLLGDDLHIFFWKKYHYIRPYIAIASRRLRLTRMTTRRRLQTSIDVVEGTTWNLRYSVWCDHAVSLAMIITCCSAACVFTGVLLGVTWNNNTICSDWYYLVVLGNLKDDKQHLSWVLLSTFCCSVSGIDVVVKRPMMFSRGVNGTGRETITCRSFKLLMIHAEF